MPIKPTPKTYSCPSCNWSKLYAPASDALFVKPPTECPRCGVTDLLVENATQVDFIADRLLNIVFRRS